MHLTIGIGASAIFYFFLLQNFRLLLADSAVQLLRLGQVVVMKTVTTDSTSLLFASAGGSRVNFALTLQSSGLFSVIAFYLLFVLLAFPLKGSLFRKFTFLHLGAFVGLLWCVVRLSVWLLLTYHFGEYAVQVAGLIGPFVDFLWVVPMWALGLSVIISSNKKQNGLEEP